MDAIRSSRSACRSRYQEGENVLVLGDQDTKRIAERLAVVAAQEGAIVLLCVMPNPGRHSLEPPPPVSAAMASANVIVSALSYSITHTDARRTANSKGARFASMTRITDEVFTNGCLLVDVPGIARVATQLGRVLSTAGHVRVTSAEGTDLELTLSGRKSVDQTGLCHEPGTWGVLPNIETAVAPLEGSANGVLVVDGIVPQFAFKPIVEPIRIVFTDGRAQKFEGGEDARALESYLRGFGDPGVFDVVELGVGLNPNAQMTRTYNESEAEYGTLHIGLGDGTTFGSDHRAATHCDLVIRHPILDVNGRRILERKQLSLSES